MTTKAKPLATLASLLLLAACDLQLLPESAQYQGDGTPRLAVVVEAAAMPTNGVVAVDLELVDVLVHRESDDAWVWLAGGTGRVELSLDGSSQQTSVPLLPDHYDRLLVVVDAPRVAVDGAWQSAALATDEIEFAIDLDLDADAEVEVSFDVDASLTGGRGDWRFDPRATVHVVGE